MREKEVMPSDVYRRTMEIARAYPLLRKRRPVFDTADKVYQAKINQWQIYAIENAWYAASADEFERIYISKNIFDGLPMHYVNVPMSQSAMRRCRKRFLEQLAVNLGFL